jgi:hypothetical protein
MSERRRTPRHTLRTDLRVLVGPERTEVRGRLVDLSPGGMLIRAANMEIEEDGLLQVHLARPDGSGATAIGRVVRCDDRGTAFCFDALWTSDEAKLATPDLWRNEQSGTLHILIDTPRWWQIWGPPVRPPATSPSRSN